MVQKSEPPVPYLEVDPSGPAPIYEQIIDGIERLVREGSLVPGARLPSVRQLAADLEVNPNTVGRAYSLLERDGLIETARRRGTRVSGGAPARAARSLTTRVDDIADRVIRETTQLGIEPRALVEAISRRLGAEAAAASKSRGKRS